MLSFLIYTLTFITLIFSISTSCFIIIEMKIRRNDSYDNSHFFKLKQLYFFKLLFDQYDLSLVKDYLKKSLDIIIFKKSTQIQLDQSNYIYVMSEETEFFINGSRQKVVVKQGRKAQTHITSFRTEEDVLIYRVKRKTVMVLETLCFLDIPFVKDMKSQEKFSFLQNCDLINLNFNSFIYRKGDELDAVYFIIQGQVKMYKQINEKIYLVSSLQSKRIFGLFQIKSSLSYRQLYAKSNVNDLQVLRIPIKLIEDLCQEQQIGIVNYISSLKSELHSMAKQQLTQRQVVRTASRQSNSRNFRHSENLVNTKQFEKRLRSFQLNRNINNSILNKMLQSKKLMIKVQEMNTKALNWMQVQNDQSLATAYDVKHYNDKWRKDKDKKHAIKQQLSLNLTTRCTQTSKYCINGLKKYPAYKRYLKNRQENQRQNKRRSANDH